jgi:hypothetical protein
MATTASCAQQIHRTSARVGGPTRREESASQGQRGGRGWWDHQAGSPASCSAWSNPRAGSSARTSRAFSRATSHGGHPGWQQTSEPGGGAGSGSTETRAPSLESHGPIQAAKGRPACSANHGSQETWTHGAGPTTTLVTSGWARSAADQAMASAPGTSPKGSRTATASQAGSGGSQGRSARRDSGIGTAITPGDRPKAPGSVVMWAAPAEIRQASAHGHPARGQGTAGGPAGHQSSAGRGVPKTKPTVEVAGTQPGTPTSTARSATTAGSTPEADQAGASQKPGLARKADPKSSCPAPTGTLRPKASGKVGPTKAHPPGTGRRPP